MKPPLIRFTLRRLMVAVAVVGLSLGVVIERRSRFGRIAAHHRAELDELNGMMISIAADDPKIGRAFWHGDMRDKYERAARYPWLPVAPDPPEPE